MAEQRPNSPKTVQFNVGGRLFETARALIDQHEGTMLTRLVSDTWQQDPTKPVFIDRDGDIFAQVLNYLRYGSIVLPSKLPKSMFLRDLDFYGIVPTEGTVKTESEGWAARVVDRYKGIKAHETEIQKLEALKEGLNLENDIELLANHCAHRYLLFTNHDKKGGRMQIYVDSNKDKNTLAGKLWNALCCATEGKYRELFQKSISNFGLHLEYIGRGSVTVAMETIPS